MNRLLVLTEDNDDYGKLLEERRLPDIEIVTTSDECHVRESIRCSNIILGAPDMVAKSWIRRNICNGSSRPLPVLKPFVERTFVETMF
ncbi:MAG TPA: hypothetical protein QF571_09860 [Desulfobacterales bacterium]|jgi:hypothetical protein|nr:hypothetical protein [Desulfobacterales bacterium]MDP7355410.1 hypothetical protein [Desulfobacterales bacterium]HJO63110.1 hypothetical protein [Desulfobacterales bacterium]